MFFLAYMTDLFVPYIHMRPFSLLFYDYKTTH